MEYSLILTPTPFNQDVLKLTKKECENNRLWQITDTLLLNAFNYPENSFIRSLEAKFNSKTTYNKFSSDVLKKIFRLLYLSGDLKSVVFTRNYDDCSENDELVGFQKYIQAEVEQRANIINKAEELFSYLLDEVFGEMWCFECWTNKEGNYIRYTLYSSSVLYLNYNDFVEQSFAFNLITTILQFMGIKHPFFKPISLLEYEKIAHPLSNSYLLLATLFEESGEAVKQKLSLADDEFIYIQNELLKYTKKFKDELVYVKETGG